jgi:hypothetical protein
MANWKVKAQSIIGRNSRSSFKIESSGRSKEDFDLNYKTAQHRLGKTMKSWLSESLSERRTVKIVTDTSSIKSSGTMSGQLKGFALVSKIGEKWVEDNSQELNEAG